MKAGGGRNKGNSFERHVSKQIVLAFSSKGITAQDCYRTPSSGGHRFAKKEDPGDLVMSPQLKKLFPFAVECKHYRKLDWHLLLDLRQMKRGQFGTWWAQAVRATNGDSIEPLLVFKQNRSAVFAMCRLEAIKNAPMPMRSIPVMATTVNQTKVRVMELESLLDLYS